MCWDRDLLPDGKNEISVNKSIDSKEVEATVLPVRLQGFGTSGFRVGQNFPTVR